MIDGELWRCPACAQKHADAIEKLQAEKERMYGRVDLDEFEALTAKIAEHRTAIARIESNHDATLNPSVGIHFGQGVDRNVLTIRFRARCAMCRAEYAFDAEQVLTPKNDKEIP